MSETCDVVVVGLGGMGAAALAHLARVRPRLRVVGVEQHEIPHAFGSSHGSSRVIRTAYFEDPRYVPLLYRSYELWRELERDSGAQLYTQTGCLNLGPRAHPLMRSLLECVRVHALPHDLLDAAALRKRFPAFSVDDEVIGLHEEDAGILQPEKCTAAHVEVAVRNGARVLVHERVLRLDVTATATATGKAIDVVTDKRTLSCAHVVLSIGPWLPSVPGAALYSPLASLMSRMTAQRQVQLWFAPPNETFAFGAFPVFIHFGRYEGDGAYYGMPPHGGNGVKVCRHGGGVPTTPDVVDRSTTAADIDDVRAFLRRTLPALGDEPVTRSEVCMYTMTPDAHFVVGRPPIDPIDDAPIVVLGGFSGHGYKMASAIGEIACELVTSGRSQQDISIFDPARLLTSPA